MDITSLYQIAKSLHLIGMVSWMAGVFYLVRIMVNHAEALKIEGPTQDILAPQYSKMEWKAYKIIAVPALVITWSSGTTMLCLQPALMTQGWMQVKLLLLIIFTVYTHYCQTHIKLLAAKKVPSSPVYYRVMNEIPTIILVLIVFLGVFRQTINWAYLGIGIAGFSGLIFYAVKKVAKRMQQ